MWVIFTLTSWVIFFFTHGVRVIFNIHPQAECTPRPSLKLKTASVRFAFLLHQQLTSLHR